MSIAALPCSYREAEEHFQSFKGHISYFFPEEKKNSVKRDLELHLSQLEIDDDSDALDILTRPLTILLIEEVPQESSSHVEGYEDVYYFTHDGDFIRHGWRKFEIDSATKRKTYIQKKYEYDGDPQKLFQRGEKIKEILQGRILHNSLADHPTVQGLISHTLWKHYKDVA